VLQVRCSSARTTACARVTSAEGCLGELCQRAIHRSAADRAGPSDRRRARAASPRPSRVRSFVHVLLVGREGHDRLTVALLLRGRA